jgi:outer membrane receptor protein involved in Fe transport
MMDRKLSYAIAAILGGSSGCAGIVMAAESDASSDAIQEIIVTAQRRTENMQDVPITIQALTAETIQQLNVATFDDFVKYLPNVTSASNGPGQSSIFMRGLSTTLPGTQGSGGIGSFPGVAIYLDDQSVAMPGRNLDVYAADLERIEVLEGPQGTLFGAGAESGVLRYITNKPKLDVTEGSVNAGYDYTSHGDPSTNVDATINIPLIADTLAVRGVIYDDSRGGYINNVPGVFAHQNTDIGIHYANYPNGCAATGTCQVPPGSVAANNASLVANDINPVTYQGFRLSALYKINQDWNVLLTQSYQSMNAQGVFYETPQSSGSSPQTLPDLSVQLYVPAYDKDRFENTALTVNGRVGDLKLVYTGGYLDRNIEQQGDYTNYSRGIYADYYQCLPGTATTMGKCYSPAAAWHDKARNTHDSQELRLSTPDEWRLRGIVGAFWEEYVINSTTEWGYKSIPPCTATVSTGCITDIGPPPGVQVNNPNVRADDVSAFDDITRGYRQQALFASGDFDIIPKRLTLTVGTRYYRINTTETGFSAESFYCMDAGPAPCTTNQPPTVPNGVVSNNETSEHLNLTYSGFRSRANLSWKVTDDALIYYTWSQGFRPGGFNRGSLLRTPPGQDYTFQSPANYAPDTLVNNEIGWKTQWMDHRFEFNGSVYQENWNHVQVELFEPCCFGNVSFLVNGPSYRVRGAETEVIAQPVHGLSIVAAAAWNSGSLTSAPFLYDTTGKPITSIQNPFGAPGSPPSQSPPFSGNVRVRYELALGNYRAFGQVAATHQAHSYSATGNATTFDQPGFSTYDAALGIGKDAWLVQFVGQNLTDTQANLYENNSQAVNAIIVNRPRTAGVRFSYKFQ